MNVSTNSANATSCGSPARMRSIASARVSGRINRSVWIHVRQQEALLLGRRPAVWEEASEQAYRFIGRANTDNAHQVQDIEALLIAAHRIVDPDRLQLERKKIRRRRHIDHQSSI